MVKKKILIIIGAVLLLAALAAAGWFGAWLPYQNAENGMPQDAGLILEAQSDGRFLLSWPESASADFYRVRILKPAETEEETELIFAQTETEQTRWLLPPLPGEQQLEICVESVAEYRILGREMVRTGTDALKVFTTFEMPVITGAQWTPDPATKTVTLNFSMEEGDQCRCWLMDENGEKTAIQTTKESVMTITFGEAGDLPMPEHGTPSRLVFDVYRENPKVQIYGALCVGMDVTREDLLDRNLTVEFQELPYNRCALSWSETKGEYYDVQMINPQEEEWITVARVPADAERSYTSPHLHPCRDYVYRVVALGGQTMPESDVAAISEQYNLATWESPIYTTIWPTKDLQLYKDPGMEEAIGTALVGQAYCVIEEAGETFGIYVDGTYGYVESAYCLINLPEYMDRMCDYNITNSYDSLYMVHEYEIPRVTGEITGGYENVRLSDGSFLVPLLYPTAQKLAVAAKVAQEEGYQLKIYDAFRPNKATREIYSRTKKILEDPLPRRTYTGVRVSLPEPAEGEEVTYELAMTDNSYSLGNFLASSTSMHNLGIALDLTLASLDDGKELKMQTSMHDLSFNSVIRKNNLSAKMLASIMKRAGFTELTSEWWHFQDNEIRNARSLVSVSEGVSPECWMADDYGWKYRGEDGSYYANCTVTIGEKEYTFDTEGYLIGDK